LKSVICISIDEWAFIVKWFVYRTRSDGII